MGKVKVALTVVSDILMGSVIGIVIGAGLLCLIPLVLIFGILFVIWMSAELIIWAITDKSDDDNNDANIGVNYADDDD